ncbi:hypothetical protein KZ813_07870 [Sphingomonas sp. RHCKR7]|uniref:glycosyltransferase n=1 Tax=Sphingomonas folli TaxID=2862497 RepID=UPI001CA48790|nr:glycosyltransferase [Sphingomonas folli]MBW6526751.1 hypothetical protein [Sphingomonas folli]
MLINLSFIRTTNGLFYFALDYIEALRDVTSVILVRTAEQAAVLDRRGFSAVTRLAGPVAAGCAVWRASRRGEMTFTPSPHPIPGCGKQLVVVHDTYPFEGRTGAVKTGLFALAMRSARAHAGYINRSDALAFLQRCGVPATRRHATPNLVPTEQVTSRRGALAVPARPAIGLFGTDSSKKNYAALFTALAALPDAARLRLLLYGQPNPYVDGLVAAFPTLSIVVCDSRAHELTSFIGAIDILASAASREGFSRPAALALAAGVPCWLVEAAVFREFYGEAAIFYADVNALADALVSALRPGAQVARPIFGLPAAMTDDYEASIAWLRREDLRPT